MAQADKRTMRELCEDAILMARTMGADAGFMDLREDLRDAVVARDEPRLRAAIATAELFVAYPVVLDVPRVGLPSAAAAATVLACEDELVVVVAEGRLAPARQRAHTRALLGALHDPTALAFAAEAVQRTVGDCY
jgi:hypothetical protein